MSFPMHRVIAFVFAVLLVLSISYGAGNVTTEGGNITQVDIFINDSTTRWAAIVGWFNNSAADVESFISSQDAPDPIIYTNWPNGSYSDFYNKTMILTRLDFKPDVSDITSPVESDFNESGMFSDFTVFSGLDFDSISDDPHDTFCNPCTWGTCYVYDTAFSCPIVSLRQNFVMGVLKFDNGTDEEPLFVQSVETRTGYNGTNFNFEYIVPAKEFYYFYVYAYKECNLRVWIDGVETTTFPRTAVPYDVRVQVTDNSSLPIQNIEVRAIEENGRNVLYPNLEEGKGSEEYGSGLSDSSGFVKFALSPTLYNIPSSYGYRIYLEVLDDGYHCVKNFTVAESSYLVPEYRTSLVDGSYESAVKSSIQNMNSLASTASKWINSQKMKLANIVVYTDGTHGPLPALKSGAPNYLNVTIINSSSMTEINGSVEMYEENGHIVWVPMQPEKVYYNNTNSFDSNESMVVIPTYYNNNANITLVVKYSNGTEITTLNLNVDGVLEEPTPAEQDMPVDVYQRIASSIQNINMVLTNMGKSVSTI